MQRANRRRIHLALSVGVLAALSSTVTALVTIEPIRADELKSCTGTFFDSSCQDDSKSPLDLRNSTSEADGVLFNYSWLTQADKAPLIEAFNTMPGKPLQDQGLRIAEETRKAAIRYVSGDKSEDKWSPQIRAAVERLRLLKFRLSEPSSSDCLTTGDPGIPNAQYRFYEHTVGICPAALKIPTAEIAATLAHEIGHSVSPCMMSKPLVKYINADRDYGVDIQPLWTDALVKTGEAERIPASQIIEPTMYRAFNACLDARYKQDYEDWLSVKELRIEHMPRTLSPAWQRRIDAARAATPQRCYERAEEHFADSFGAYAYEAWLTNREASNKSAQVGLHFLINTKCAHDLNPKAVAFQNFHASDSDRIALFLKPAGIAARIGCSENKENICSLSPNTYATEDDTSTTSQGSGTKP
jgi:hypothetical protein